MKMKIINKIIIIMIINKMKIQKLITNIYKMKMMKQKKIQIIKMKVIEN